METRARTCGPVAGERRAVRFSAARLTAAHPAHGRAEARTRARLTAGCAAMGGEGPRRRDTASPAHPPPLSHAHTQLSPPLLSPPPLPPPPPFPFPFPHWTHPSIRRARPAPGPPTPRSYVTQVLHVAWSCPRPGPSPRASTSESSTAHFRVIHGAHPSHPRRTSESSTAHIRVINCAPAPSPAVPPGPPPRAAPATRRRRRRLEPGRGWASFAGLMFEARPEGGEAGAGERGAGK